MIVTHEVRQIYQDLCLLHDDEEEVNVSKNFDELLKLDHIYHHYKTDDEIIGQTNRSKIHLKKIVHGFDLLQKISQIQILGIMLKISE